MIGGVPLTPWQIAGIALTLAVCFAAWIWGGRVERLAAAVLLIDLLVTSVAFTWTIDGVYLASMTQDGVRLLIFGWLCFRSDRWWLFVATAAHAIMIFIDGAELLSPAMSYMAAASALVGLGFLTALALLFGVWERWLAGEPAAGPAGWAQADQATARRRSRRNRTRLPEPRAL